MFFPASPPFCKAQHTPRRGREGKGALATRWCGDCGGGGGVNVERERERERERLVEI